MASSYIPNKNTIIKVGVSVLILFALLKFLPVPENVRSLFRV